MPPSLSLTPSLHHSLLVSLIPTMAGKNRQKNAEKNGSASSGSEDVPKKSAAKSNGAPGPGAQGPPSGGSCLGLLASSLFYVALVGAAGVAAFYSQQVLEEMRQTNARHEESARNNAELSLRMAQVVEQTESLARVVDGLESSLGVTRVELEGAVARMKRGEVETRRVDDNLQKLQNDLLRELSKGIAEVKTSRERDFSSLERTVEERLSEVSASISGSVSVFSEAQEEARGQLEELKARLGQQDDPALIKEELGAIVEAVAELKVSGEARDAAAESLGAQVGAVRSEFQTRNQEVASLSQEVEAVRAVVQTTAGSLKEALSAAQAQIQILTDESQTLRGGTERIDEEVRDVQKRVDEASSQAQRRWEELDAKVKSLEEGAESQSRELSDRTESLMNKYDQSQNVLTKQGQTLENVREELKDARSSLKEVQTKTSSRSLSEGSGVDKMVQGLEARMEAVEKNRLETLRKAVESLETRAAKHEGHQKAIAALQDAVQKTTQTLAKLAKQPQKK